jgi:hypothetical protein
MDLKNNGIEVFNMLKHLITNYNVEDIILKRNDAVFNLSYYVPQPSLLFYFNPRVASFIEGFGAINGQPRLSGFMNDFAAATPVVEHNWPALSRVGRHLA